MKRGTPDHPKMKRLARLLGIELWGAIGILEGIWHFTGRYTPQGDLGKFSNQEIADEIGWRGDADKLIDCLIQARWLDADTTHRILVHDWKDHCDRAVSKYLKDHKLDFFAPSSVNLVRTAAHKVEPNGAPGAPKCAPSDSDSEPDSLPEPEPEPDSDSHSEPFVRMCVGDEDFNPEPEPPLSAGEPIPQSLLREMWRYYPRQIAQDAAYPEMEAAVRRVMSERSTDVHGAAGWILARVKAYARSDVVKKGEARFIPQPARWFKEGRYKDDDAAWKMGDSIKLGDEVDTLAEWERQQAGGAA